GDHVLTRPGVQREPWRARHERLLAALHRQPGASHPRPRDELGLGGARRARALALWPRARVPPPALGWRRHRAGDGPRVPWRRLPAPRDGAGAPRGATARASRLAHAKLRGDRSHRARLRRSARRAVAPVALGTLARLGL